jgi:allophanate hydrolase
MQVCIPGGVPLSPSPSLCATIGNWLTTATSGPGNLGTALHDLRDRIDPADPAWITIVSATELDEQLTALEQESANTEDLLERFPLYGVPFAVKDNIDAAGMATTAGCPEFGRIANEDAAAVARLKAAGAILIGKTNLDQFATGLVGTRSPYGAVPNAFNPEYVSGGSSSGSAVVVARGLVPFSLGTDTAGSGRVPASFNNIVGLKPTRGAISTRGVVPACRSLDCVSIFATTVEDAEMVYRVARGPDDADPYSRALPAHEDAVRFSSRPCFAIPADPMWFGDTLGETAFKQTLEKLASLGVTLKPVDFTPMHEMAALLYEGPWVAERLAVIEEFLASNPEAVNPIVRSIIEKGAEFSAVDAYRAEYVRVELARAINSVFNGCDALLTPSAPTFPSIAEVNANPVEANSRLGTYTNFVNLSDCSALALPAGFRSDGLPFGITLIASAWRDSALSAFGKRWTQEMSLPLGATGAPFPSATASPPPPVENMVRLAVVGAHLSGMPLNGQLVERGSRYVETTTTSNVYRLYALPGTVPPKPGLIRATRGAPIEVELWDVPVEHFGSFVALIPSPLGIGTLELADGRQVKGFICEGHVADSALDITALGGWRAFMKSRSAAPV